jgi:small conductance mechanosensitive channel
MSTLYDWFTAHGLRILLIILVGLALQLLLKSFSKKLIKIILKQAKVVINGSKEIDERRLQTLSNIFTNTGSVIVVSTAIIMILSELGFNIAPILAGAGIVGLAVGFGSQSLVKDLVSGLFILIENQYVVGDKVSFGSINGVKVEGLVKGLNLRRTMVEDSDGNVHIVPNGKISLVTKVKSVEKN